MSGLLAPHSAEARALDAVRPDLMRVLEHLEVTDRQRQAAKSWKDHDDACDPRRRSERVADDLGITARAAKQLLTRIGLYETTPGRDRARATRMFSNGYSVDEVRVAISGIHRVTLCLAIRDYAHELAETAAAAEETD